jgi:teichuronic acid biosynthesis glycosyltransferase TuaH
MKPKNNKPDIVLMTLFRSDHEYSSVSLSWAKELAKETRVLYVNHPYSLRDFFQFIFNKKMWQRFWNMATFQTGYEKPYPNQENLIVVQPPFTLPINWLSPGKWYNRFYRLNNAIVLRSIRMALKKHQAKDFIYLNCYDPYFAGYLPKGFGQQLSIYQSIDDITQDPYSVKHGARMESIAIRKSDFALATSNQLRKNLQRYNPKVYTAFNAVDIDIFKKTLEEKFDKPAEIQHISTPIIGFIGNLDALRIDYHLLKKTALAHPDKTVLLVGPINSKTFFEIGLNKLPNVVTTGAKNIKELPSYMQYMDVCLIPFLCNKLTESIYPLKINEYLAAGRPVISTGFSDDIRTFRDVIYLADSHHEFISLIDRALDENSKDAVQQRVEVAQTNTWSARIDQFWDLVDQHLQHKPTKEYEENPSF